MRMKLHLGARAIESKEMSERTVMRFACAPLTHLLAPSKPRLTAYTFFLDAFSHLYERVCLSVRPTLHPSVLP